MGSLSVVLNVQTTKPPRSETSPAIFGSGIAPLSSPLLPSVEILEAAADLLLQGGQRLLRACQGGLALLQRLAFGLHPEQLGSIVENGFFRCFSSRFPSRAAELVEIRRSPTHADIFADEVGLFQRNT